MAAQLSEKAREQAVYETFAEIVTIGENIKTALAASGQYNKGVEAALAKLNEHAANMTDAAQAYRNASVGLGNAAVAEYKAAAAAVDEVIAKKAVDAVSKAIKTLLDDTVKEPVEAFTTAAAAAEQAKAAAAWEKVSRLSDEVTIRRGFFAGAMVLVVLVGVWAGSAIDMHWTQGDLAKLDKQIVSAKAEKAALTKQIGPFIQTCDAAHGVSAGPCIPVAVPAQAAPYLPSNTVGGKQIWYARLDPRLLDFYARHNK